MEGSNSAWNSFCAGIPNSCSCNTRHPTDPFTRRWIHLAENFTKNLPIGCQFPAWHQNSSVQEQEWVTRHRDCLRFLYPGRAESSTRNHRIRDRQGESPALQLYCWLLNTVPEPHHTKGISYKILAEKNPIVWHWETGSWNVILDFQKPSLPVTANVFNPSERQGTFSLLKQRDGAQCWPGSLSRTPADSCMTMDYSFPADHSTRKWFQMLACLSEWWGLIRSYNERHHRGVGCFCWSGASCRLQHSFILLLSQTSIPRPFPQNILHITTVISKRINTALTHDEPVRRSREWLLKHKVLHSSCPKACWKSHSSTWEWHSHN